MTRIDEDYDLRLHPGLHRPTDPENQRFEIVKFCDEKRLHIDQSVEETIIHEFLAKRVPHSAIARILGVNRGTLTTFVKSHLPR